jgi:hypothetical protein
LLTEHIALKKDWGEEFKVQRVSAPVRDQIVDFISHWKQRSGLRDNWFCRAFGLKQENSLPGESDMGCQTNTMGPCPKIPSYVKRRSRQSSLSSLQTVVMIIGAVHI